MSYCKPVTAHAHMIPFDRKSTGRPDNHPYDREWATDEILDLFDSPVAHWDLVAYSVASADARI